MPTKMPLPTRKSDKTLYFSDYPEFKPNLTPEEIFRMGSFGGTYYRPIYSTINNRKYTGAYKEFEKHGWFDGLNIKTQVASSVCRPNLNTYGVKSGLSLLEWEKSKWIEPIDPYGWFQWYCRFYLGRRCYDDERQIDRWNKYAGEESGRWRKRLINMCIKKGKKYNDYSVSPVIRQGLQHWGYKLNLKDYNKHKKPQTIEQH